MSNMSDLALASRIAANGTAPGTIPDRLEPNNVEAEEAVLGALLIDCDAILRVANFLQSSDFYVERHAWLYKTILDLYERGEPADLVTISDEMDRRGQLEEAGGAAWLTSLMNATPTSIHVDYYARIVERAAGKRRLIAAAGQVARLAHDPAAELAEVIARAQEIIGQAAKRRGETWRVFTLADAYKPRPPVEWVVEGLFALPSLNVVYGLPGTMKSLLLADLLTCVVGDQPWLEPLPGQKAKSRATIQKPALWCDFDNGQRLTHERFEALARTRNLDPAKTTLYYVSMPSPWLDANALPEIDALADLANRLGVKLIAIDNLGVVSGGVDENSAEMIKVMSNLRRLSEATGAAVVVIHHQRKGNGLKGHAKDTLRGHSSILASLDLALLVERKEDNDALAVKSTKTRQVDVFPFSAQFTYEHKPNSVELAEARFFGLEPEKDEITEALQAGIFTCVKTNPGLSQNKLIQAVKDQQPKAPGFNRIRDEILKMVEAGKLRASGAGNGNSFAYWPNDYVDS